MVRASAYCLQMQPDKSIVMQDCTKELNQKWSFDTSGRIHSEDNAALCIDRNLKSSKVSMNNCLDEKNQQWYFSGQVTRGWKICKLKLGGEDLPTAEMETNLPDASCWIKDYKELWMSCQVPSMIFTGTRFEHELANTPVMCGSGQVLSYLEKTSTSFRYKCAHIAGLGACREGWTRQIDTSSGLVRELAGLEVSCLDTSETLKGFAAEISSAGHWLRFRYSCCEAGGVPAAIAEVDEPFLAKTSKFANMPAFLAEGLNPAEGIYCPSNRDATGRLTFDRLQTFPATAEISSGTLSFDPSHQSWCLHPSDCAKGGFAHPLDVQLQAGTGWEVVGMTDFDGQFVARGVVKFTAPKPNKKTKKETANTVDFHCKRN